MNANLYLERIGISPAEVAHTYAFLKKLQESHICTVPYENLDILNKEQREAVETINGPVMVFAGAGTGKTKTLTARIAYMVAECNIKPYNILAITFTKKATNEMKERLISILDEDAKYLNSIIKNSELIIYKNSTHFSYLEYSYLTNKILDKYLK